VDREVATFMHATVVTFGYVDHVGLELECGILVAVPLILKCHTHLLQVTNLKLSLSLTT
jgi:hypothetical protein